MKPEQKKYLFIGAVIVVLLLVGYLVFSGKNTQPSSNNSEVSPTHEMVPTIDNSVKVSFTASSDKHEIDLQVSNMPSGTTTVDYELSYQTAAEGLQGVIGTATINGSSDMEKKITLGTCSSGTCVYHQVVGKIDLTLKFTGSYGQKLFEKQYSL